MTPGKNNLRAPALVFHGYNVATDSVAHIVFFSGDALAAGHASFKLAEIHHDIALFETTDGATHDIARAVFEFIVNLLFLSLTQTLHHGLFGSLHRDASKVFWCHIKVKISTNFGCRILFLGDRERDFVELIDIIVVRHDLKTGQNPGISLPLVNFRFQGLNSVSTGNHLTIGRAKGIFQGLDNAFALDGFFFFVELDEGDDIGSHCKFDCT